MLQVAELELYEGHFDEATRLLCRAVESPVRVLMWCDVCNGSWRLQFVPVTVDSFFSYPVPSGWLKWRSTEPEIFYSNALSALQVSTCIC